MIIILIIWNILLTILFGGLAMLVFSELSKTDEELLDMKNMIHNLSKEVDGKEEKWYR